MKFTFTHCRDGFLKKGGAILFFSLLFLSCSQPSIESPIQEKEAPRLFPDYTGLIIPPNIAPLNFNIEEEGDWYAVRIKGETGREITVSQSTPDIKIGGKEWKALLASSRSRTLSIDICIRRENGWHRYPPVINRIAAEPIDPYLFYRDIVPTNSLWNRMAMHQRDLESFNEYGLIDNYRIDHNCMNCHTFNRNNPAEMLFHIRGNHGGTVIGKDGELKKISFPAHRVISDGTYCNWHPSGLIIAFAVNKIKQNYYLSGYADKMKEVYDTESDIVFYHVEENRLFSSPQISSGERINLPAWSADGRFLYFVTAPPYVVNQPNEEIRYSLMRASYDIGTQRAGTPEMLVSAWEMGGSISFPTASPDGKYLFFCVADFGYFPVNNKSADLYLMDTGTGAVCKPEINSPESESYVSWSSNSRWFVFSSRRLDGMASKPFICYIDGEGRTSKPFVIPQKDPVFYRTDRRNFSRPELLKEKMALTFRELRPLIFRPPVTAGFEHE
jgi:hypothetical protein